MTQDHTFIIYICNSFPLFLILILRNDNLLATLTIYGKNGLLNYPKIWLDIDLKIILLEY